MEMQYPQVVQNVIVESSDTAVKELVKNHNTVYGAVACTLEQNTEEINKTIENIASFFATKKGLEITKEYEKNCTLYEKWIKNDPIKLKQMELQRAAETDLTSTAIQVGAKGALYGVKYILNKLDEKEVKRSLWNLCVKFAQEISNSDLNRVCMDARLIHIHDQLIGNGLFRKKDINKIIDLQSDPEYVFIPPSSIERDNAAHLLYLIYRSAHNMAAYYNKSEEQNFNKLMEYWEYLGVWGNHKGDLFNKMEILDKGNTDEFVRMSKLIQSFYSNLAISTPNINKSISRNINNELLKYVPNGDAQLASRKVGKVITKAAITAASCIVGTQIPNPVLLNTAATAATSLLNDFQNTEVIGKCLKDSGIDDNAVKTIIEKGAGKRLMQK